MCGSKIRKNDTFFSSSFSASNLAFNCILTIWSVNSYNIDEKIQKNTKKLFKKPREKAHKKHTHTVARRTVRQGPPYPCLPNITTFLFFSSCLQLPPFSSSCHPLHFSSPLAQQAHPPHFQSRTLDRVWLDPPCAGSLWDSPLADELHIACNTMTHFCLLLRRAILRLLSWRTLDETKGLPYNLPLHSTQSFRRLCCRVFGTSSEELI